jgi:hypothetical protein
MLLEGVTVNYEGPLRVAGVSWPLFLWEPFRLVPTPSNRAGATPCTRNDCWWLTLVCCVCLGCDQSALVLVRLFFCSLVRLGCER